MLQNKTLEDWLDYIQNQHTSEMELGLERVRTVAIRLNIIQHSARVITVAGTNGKGTTCNALSTFLIESGVNVGVFSSPHLFDYRERVLVNQHKLSAQEHCSAFEHIENVRGKIPLTYFEYSTLAALWLFSQAKLDVIILEVGLGGRLDATNIVDADAVIVTSIALDHCEILGNTREKIAVEKAGVFRKNIPVVYAERTPPQSMLEIASKLDCQWLQPEQGYRFEVGQENDWSYRGQRWHLDKLPKPKIPIANVAAALALLEVCFPNLYSERLKAACNKIEVLGRLQTLSHQPKIMVDVAHNPHAARYLAENIKHNKPAHCIALIGMLMDKDCAGVLRKLSEVVDEWFLVDQSDIPRGASLAALQAHLQPLTKQPSKHFASMDAALNAAMTHAKQDTLILVTGSFYAVTRAMLWDQHRIETRGNA